MMGAMALRGSFHSFFIPIIFSLSHIDTPQGKMYDVPVISVNGHDVNALVKAANIAMAWR